MFAYIELGRIYRVAADGSLTSALAIDPNMVVRRINALNRVDGSDPEQGRGDPVSAVARLARGSEVVEIEVNAPTRDAGVRQVDRVVSTIRTDLEPLRAEAFAQLEKLERQTSIEIERLAKWADLLESMYLENTRTTNHARNGSLLLALSMLRVDVDRQIRELRRLDLAYVEAKNQMDQRNTRLLLPPFIQSAPLSSSLYFGAMGFFVGALVAGTGVFLLRRS